MKVTGAGAAGPRNSALALLLGPKVEAVIWRRVARREIRKDLGAGKEADGQLGCRARCTPKLAPCCPDLQPPDREAGEWDRGGRNHSAP